MSSELRKPNLRAAFFNGAMMLFRPLWQSPDYSGKDIASALEGDWIAVGKDIGRMLRRENEKKES